MPRPDGLAGWDGSPQTSPMKRKNKNNNNKKNKRGKLPPRPAPPCLASPRPIPSKAPGAITSNSYINFTFSPQYMFF